MSVCANRSTSRSLSLESSRVHHFQFAQTTTHEMVSHVKETITMSMSIESSTEPPMLVSRCIALHTFLQNGSKFCQLRDTTAGVLGAS